MKADASGYLHDFLVLAGRGGSEFDLTPGTERMVRLALWPEGSVTGRIWDESGLPMPYVPPEVKERIKREVSIQRLAEARGIKLVRSGKELIGLPFHDDRNPSLNIDPAKNVWSCKGACGEEPSSQAAGRGENEKNEQKSQLRASAGTA